MTTRRDGNRLYYRANTAHPLYPELRGLVLKTSGIAAELRRALEPVNLEREMNRRWTRIHTDNQRVVWSV